VLGFRAFAATGGASQHEAEDEGGAIHGRGGRSHLGQE